MMNKAILTLAMAAMMTTACAQNDTISTTTSCGYVCEIYEQMPSFPGGNKALMKYLAENVKWPVGIEEGISGRVIVSFTVNEDGSLCDFKVAHSVHPALDKEALRVMKAMPRWIPGSICGRPVKVRYNVPITFR